jgi:hypothetical protein
MKERLCRPEKLKGIKGKLCSAKIKGIEGKLGLF